MTDYTNQLIDFMYVDRPKVSSLLAQFLSEGLVVTQDVSISNEATHKKSIDASAKIASFLGVSGKFEGSKADKSSETVKKNPEWAQAKALVQYVADAEDQENTGDSIGQLRILTGSLEVYDLTPFRQIAENPRLLSSIKKAVMLQPAKILGAVREIDQKIIELSSGGNPKANPKNNPQIKMLEVERTKSLDALDVYLEAAIEGISHVVRHSPFSIVAILTVDETKYWFSLKQESLLHDQGDTLLKYGYSIEGLWSVACIVDGADFNGDNEHKGDSLQWANVVRPFADIARKVAGRPEDYCSLMPLVVFRGLGTILR